MCRFAGHWHRSTHRNAMGRTHQPETDVALMVMIAGRAFRRETQEDLICLFGGGTGDDGGMLPLQYPWTKHVEHIVMRVVCESWVVSLRD